MQEKKAVESTPKPPITDEQILRSILQASPIPTFVIGSDHCVLYWNRALEELSNIPASQVMGTTEHWRAFYSEPRPCMADLLVDRQGSKIPDWYEGKYRKSKLIAEAFETTDF